MRAQTLAHRIDIDRVDLEALNNFLISDRAPPDSMLLSELDGFLTGIAIGPDLIRPREWLPLIWGGEAPAYANLDEANAILGLLMARYYEILREATDHSLAPIFWTASDGAIIAADWAEGFFQAIRLRIDAWERLFASERDGKLLVPILSLCRDKNGHSLLGLPPGTHDRIVEQAPEYIPACVIEIAAYWRRKRPRQASTSVSAEPQLRPSRMAAKVGRNDPCPCGSGRKFKKCCGQSA